MNVCRCCCKLHQEAENYPQSRKIELVAGAMRAAMLACPGGQGRFLRPILASFAVVGEVEGALGIIKQVKERQLAAEGESLGHFSWHAALSHCSLLVMALSNHSASCQGLMRIHIDHS